MSKSLFITAVGTDVGKTYISALLVKKLRKYNLNTGYFKPVLSGAVVDNEGVLHPQDCEFVLNFASIDSDPYSCVSYCFQNPVSPHLAAFYERVTISEDKIKDDYIKYSSNYDYMVVEGAGGLAVPLRVADSPLMISDIVKLLNSKLVIVSNSGLGCIHNILTTVEYAKSKNIFVSGIILNKFDENNNVHKDNLRQIQFFTGIDVVATVQENAKDLEISKERLVGLFN